MLSKGEKKKFPYRSKKKNKESCLLKKKRCVTLYCIITKKK